MQHLETGNIALSMLVVFGGAKLLGEIFERLRMPALVGEIVAGFLVGPAVLQWIVWDSTLSALADLGVMFLLFRVGLEVRASELIKVGKTAGLVAVAGVAIPFAAGWGIARLWGQPNFEAFFVAAAMVATSVGITAQILAAKGLLKKESAQIILAAAVIDDILGLLVLAVVSSMAEGPINIPGLVMTALLATGFTFIVAKWGTPAMGRLVPGLERFLKAPEAQFNIAMVLLFVLSLGAVYAGVAPIVGAFLAGMALADSVNPRVHHLAQGVSELMGPFFLAGIGVQLDLTVLKSASLIWFAVAIFVAAVLSKLVGCGLGAMGLGRRAALQVGVGMAPRGEVGMVVAQIGARLGAISPQVYGVVVLMSIGTTIAAAPMLAWAYRGEHPKNQS